MLSVLDVRLFFALISFTVVLNFLAILYRLSPFWTVYVFELVVGIFNTWPIDNKLDDRLFNFIISFWVVLNFLAMAYRLSPLTTV